MNASSQWQDLMPRILSAVVMMAVGAVAIWFGGWLFRLTVCAVGGLMVWEAARMFNASRPRADGILATSTLVMSQLLPAFFIFPLIIAASVITSGRVSRDKYMFFMYYVWITIACIGIMMLRDIGGFNWFFWCICVVIATDVAGYFAGRLLGGPKFWPAVSPKKTWSGTTAGWIASAVIGWMLAPVLGVGSTLIMASVLVSFASQMGDIAESAVKRRAGVKDSSDLIPGHGGVLDRFDGLMGGALAALIILIAQLTMATG